MNAGEVLHLTGANGTGKTSLLRIIAGALPPAGGEILWNDKSFFDEEAARDAAPRFTFLPADDRALKPLETAAENLGFWASLWGLKDTAADDALCLLDMKKHAGKSVRHLSAGQRRRLSIARALMKPADVWLLDEPFNGLDAEAQMLLSAALEIHMAKGGLAVIASHVALDPPRQGRLQRLDLAQFMQKNAA